MSSSQHPAVTITLSPTQVAEVVRSASAPSGAGIAALIARSLGGQPVANGTTASAAAHANDEASAADRASVQEGELDGADGRLSLSLLRGIALLAAFEDTRERGIVELARELRMSASTTHRYAQTLLELGLVERDARTRKYRLASGRANGASGANGAARPHAPALRRRG